MSIQYKLKFTSIFQICVINNISITTVQYNDLCENKTIYLKLWIFINQLEQFDLVQKCLPLNFNIHILNLLLNQIMMLVIKCYCFKWRIAVNENSKVSFTLKLRCLYLILERISRSGWIFRSVNLSHQAHLQWIHVLSHCHIYHS